MRSFQWSLVTILSLLLTTSAAADPIRFTNDEVDLGGSSQIDLTTQYSTFGLMFSNVYRYIDNRDPFPEPVGDSFGIANGRVGDNGSASVFGNVLFSTPTRFVQFDWWTVASDTFTLNAFDITGALVASFTGAGAFGSTTLWPTQPIAKFAFGDSGGWVAISNLAFEAADPVPEPGTLVLLVGGAAAAAVARYRRRQCVCDTAPRASCCSKEPEK